jgi:aminoglycoside phosphotransferase (APT) family kinase protein
MTPLDRARRITERLVGRREEPVALGRGTEHAAFTVGPYIVRVTTADDDATAEVDATAEAVVREATLLGRLQTRLPVAVPNPSFVCEELGGFAYRRLPGRPLLDTTISDTTRLAHDLGTFLRAMADIDVAAISDLVAPDLYPLDRWRDEVVAQLTDVGDALTSRERHLIHAFASEPTPTDRAALAFCHNDLGAEHLLVDDTAGHLLGVLDWSDAALTDPSRDVGRLTRDLDPRTLDRVLTTADLPPTHVDDHLVAFHARLATLEDLHHGIVTGDRRYVEAARNVFDRLFTPRD